MKSILHYGCFCLYCIFLTSCITIDPIEGQTTFSIENTTEESVKVLYTYIENTSSFAEKSDSAIIEPKTTNMINLFIWNPDLTPSNLYKEIIFISLQNDTLYNMSIINNDEWILTDSIKDYGYQVGYYHWLYKFK